MRKAILIVLMMTMVSVSCFAATIFGIVYCDYRDARADCGDVMLISHSTGDTTIACVTDNGEYSVNVNDDIYTVFARVVRKDGTSDLYQSGVTVIEVSGPFSYDVTLDANASCLLRRVCNCGLKGSEEE
jgi:uncharacterized membrane protein